ncbi:MAG: hypothetical protein ACOYNI_03810 [Acidimicrobiia bacterium]
MDDHSATATNDWPALEAELCRLPDVQAARIVADRLGPQEIHVVARTTKPAKHVVRDVQSVVLATSGLEIDRRIVSVVQLGDDAAANDNGGAGTEPRRVRIVAITAEHSGLRSLVRVTLALGDDEATGFAEGSIASVARHRLVAHATLDALRQVRPDAEAMDVEAAQVAHIGASDVAAVTMVHVVPPREEVTVGSAIVRNRDDAEAMARAVLDATNRRLSAPR